MQRWCPTLRCYMQLIRIYCMTEVHCFANQIYLLSVILYCVSLLRQEEVFLPWMWLEKH